MCDRAVAECHSSIIGKIHVLERDVAQWLERGALPMSLPAVRFQIPLGAGFSEEYLQNCRLSVELKWHTDEQHKLCQPESAPGKWCEFEQDLFVILCKRPKAHKELEHGNISATDNDCFPFVSVNVDHACNHLVKEIKLYRQ